MSSSKRKEFKDLFILSNNQLFAKVDISIGDVDYNIGDVITDTYFRETNFDLMDNPESHFYVLDGKILKGRVSLI